MIVLYVTTTLTTASGGTFAVPIGVEDESLEAFVERLSNERIATVRGLKLTPRDREGVQYIVDSWPFALGVAAVGTIQNNRNPVRRVFADDPEVA